MKRSFVDLLERAGATFAQAFLAPIVLGTATNLGAVKIAAVAGALAVAKFLLVKANAFLAKPTVVQRIQAATPPTNYTQVFRAPLVPEAPSAASTSTPSA